jgi:hypothetical protein
MCEGQYAPMYANPECEQVAKLMARLNPNTVSLDDESRTAQCTCAPKSEVSMKHERRQEQGRDQRGKRLSG